MKFEVEITYNTPHSNSGNKVRGKTLAHAFRNLDKKFKMLMMESPDITKYYIHDLKINLIRV